MFFFGLTLTSCSAHTHTVAEKLKKQGRELAEEQNDCEEVEDEQGNTYSRKTYDMMKRQGLL